MDKDKLKTLILGIVISLLLIAIAIGVIAFIIYLNKGSVLNQFAYNTTLVSYKII